MCAASDEFTTSQARMLLAASCPIRWNTRSAPERSTRTAMPGYFASNALPTFSDSGRSTEVYQTTLPSFFAASISAGVTAAPAGACAMTRVENAAAPSAVAPFSKSRRVGLRAGIAPSRSFF
jgi:hypothetical protein